MSKFEIFLMVFACATPVIALVMLLPKFKLKFKKKEKKVAQEVKSYAEIKAEEKPKEVKLQEKPKEVKRFAASDDISTDDFKSYLNKRKSINRPSRLDLPDDYVDRTMPYTPRRRKRIAEKPKSLAEEINNLSPELKALLLGGAFDKKDYD